MTNREIAIELAEYLGSMRKLAESRREFLVRIAAGRDLSPLHDQIAKLAQWEKLVREAVA